MPYELTKESILAECDRLGVIFVDHRQAAAQKIINAAAWARFGTRMGIVHYEDYDLRVWMTVRPMKAIVHPIGVDPSSRWKIVAHELVHWHQQPDSRIAFWIWVTRYLTSQRRRWEIEAPAHLVNLKLHVDNHLPTMVDEMREFYYLNDIKRDEMMHWFDARLQE
jgi:hypothetical protein